MLSNVIREHASYASGVLSIMRTFGQCTGAAAVAVLLAADERSIHVALERRRGLCGIGRRQREPVA